MVDNRAAVVALIHRSCGEEPVVGARIAFYRDGSPADGAA